MHLDLALLRKMWPHATQELVTAVANSSAAVFAKYNLDTPLRVAHFMAQISAETDGGGRETISENLNYTTPERIAAVWPKRFTVESARPYVHNARVLANKVYGDRMGNRPGTDDGYDYRGRGLLQITGRDSYIEIGKLCGINLIGNPDLASTPAYALDVAACEFANLRCLPACDADDVKLVTLRVNGGYNGLADRTIWLSKWKAVLKTEELPEQQAPTPPRAPVSPVPEPDKKVGLLELLASIFRAIFWKK